MISLELLCGDDVVLNSYIRIHIPQLDEIKRINEDVYYATVYKMCATPSDYKVVLDDNGLDWSKLDDWEFFLMNYRNYDEEEKRVLSLLFGDFDITKFTINTREEFNDLVLFFDDFVFDKATYYQLVDILREIHNFEKKVDKPGNEHARKYILDKERRQRRFNKRIKKKKESRLAKYIVALVNTQEFKYDFSTVWSLNLYQFYQSLKQIQKLKNYNIVMRGVYGGTVDSKNLDMSNIHWLAAKDK